MSFCYARPASPALELGANVAPGRDVDGGATPILHDDVRVP